MPTAPSPALNSDRVDRALLSTRPHVPWEARGDLLFPLVSLGGWPKTVAQRNTVHVEGSVVLVPGSGL